MDKISTLKTIILLKSDKKINRWYNNYIDYWTCQKSSTIVEDFCDIDMWYFLKYVCFMGFYIRLYISKNVQVFGVTMYKFSVFMYMAGYKIFYKPLWYA